MTFKYLQGWCQSYQPSSTLCVLPSPFSPVHSFLHNSGAQWHRGMRHIRFWVLRQNLLVGSVHCWFWSFHGILPAVKKKRRTPALSCELVIIRCVCGAARAKFFTSRSLSCPVSEKKPRMTDVPELCSLHRFMIQTKTQTAADSDGFSRRGVRKNKNSC